MALQFGTPIVPVSVVGSFEFNKKTSWLIRPGTVTVYLHDVIETKDLRKEDFPALRDRVHAIIAGPIEEAPGLCGKDPNRGLMYALRVDEPSYGHSLRGSISWSLLTFCSTRPSLLQVQAAQATRLLFPRLVIAMVSPFRTNLRYRPRRVLS